MHPFRIFVILFAELYSVFDLVGSDYLSYFFTNETLTKASHSNQQRKAPIPMLLLMQKTVFGFLLLLAGQSGPNK